MAFEVNDILIENNLTVSGTLVVSGQLIVGPGGTDITAMVAAVSGNLIQSGQIILASTNLLNTADQTLSGSIIASGQTLLAIDNLFNTAIATNSGNLIQSGQVILASTNLLNTADQTLSGSMIQSGQILTTADNLIRTAIATNSGNLIQSGQVILASTNLLNTADQTLSGNLIASGQVTVPVIHGGTGATTVSGALNALSPSTTSGDLIVYDGFVHTRLAAIASGAVLFTDPTHTPGLIWKPKTTAFDSLAPTTTSGDLIVFGNATNGRFGVGSSGQIVIADPTQAFGMAWKSIDIDAQTVNGTAATTTTSATLVDIAGATLTTTGRSNTKLYHIIFTGTFSHSANNQTMSIQLSTDGTAQTNTLRTVRAAATAGANFTNSTNFVVAVAPGKIIKMQWSTTGGTLTLQVGTLTIFGIA